MLNYIPRALLALLMMTAGVFHFVVPHTFEQIVPPYLPWALGLVYVSGFFEILGGIGLLVPRVSRAAAWGLILLYIAVFPANLHMALNNIAVNGERFPIASWVRLPLQALLILWAYQYTRAPKGQNEQY